MRLSPPRGVAVNVNRSIEEILAGELGGELDDSVFESLGLPGRAV